MPISNYTTKIDAGRTLAEIQRILAANGCRKVVVDYDGEGTPSAVTFTIVWQGSPVFFALPCNHAGVLEAMLQGGAPRHLRTPEQAARVGWRIVRDWIEAQMAIVQAGLATFPEVFLPYAVTDTGKTLYQSIEAGGVVGILPPRK